MNDAHSHSQTTTHDKGHEEFLLLLTGGDIKHIFLLQFYAIESRKVPIFRYHSHKKKMKHLNLHRSPTERKRN